MATPDAETDFADQLAVRLPGDVIRAGSGQTTWVGPERTSDEVGFQAVFVQAFAGQQDLHSDGRVRWFEVQVTIRFSREDYAGADALARRVHDAMDLTGSFTVNGNAYMDCRAMAAGPGYLGAAESDAEYFAETFSLWYDG